MEVQDDEIDLRDVIKVIIKRWKMILLPAIVVALLAGGVMRTMPKQYESYALLKIGHIGTAQIESIASIGEIMNSHPIRNEIASKMQSDNPKYVGTLTGLLKYENISELLSIKAFGQTPAQAQQLAQAATEIVIARHNDRCVNAQKEMDQTLKYVKNAIMPVPLSMGINEIRIEQTKIEVPAILNTEPGKDKNKVKVLAIFFAVILLDMLIVFYLEGKENN